MKKNIKNIFNGFYNDFILKKIPIAIKKYKIYIIKTDFIRFIIKLNYINIDLKKIKAIINWQDLENVIGLRLFLRFYNYYKQFIIKWLNKFFFYINNKEREIIEIGNKVIKTV